MVRRLPRLISLALGFTLFLSACGQEKPSEFQSEVNAQLILALGDFSVYYENYAQKAAASLDRVFQLIIPPIQRLGWQETAEFFKEAIPKTKGELAELCRGASGFYGEIDDLDYGSAKREDFQDICQRLYPYLQSLSRHLALPLAESVGPVNSGTAVNPGTDTSPPGSDPTGQTIPDGRWDGGKAQDKGGLETLNGYSIVFGGGFAYFGSTYDTADFIIQHGTKMTYDIQGNRITFRSVKDPRSSTMTYAGDAITDNTDPEQ